MSNTPSDAEIEKLAAEHLKAFSLFPMGGQVWFEGERILAIPYETIADRARIELPPIPHRLFRQDNLVSPPAGLAAASADILRGLRPSRAQAQYPNPPRTCASRSWAG